MIFEYNGSAHLTVPYTWTKDGGVKFQREHYTFTDGPKKGERIWITDKVDESEMSSTFLKVMKNNRTFWFQNETF